jgi:hypothetical protein
VKKIKNNTTPAKRKAEYEMRAKGLKNWDAKISLTIDSFPTKIGIKARTIPKMKK